MKKITRFILFALLLVSTSELYAQFGFQAGYIYSPSKGNLELGTSREISGTSRNNGFQAGITYDFKLKGEFSIQTALLYSFAGGKTKESQRTINGIYGNQTTSATYQFLDLPIRLAYSLPVTNDFKFFFFGGPLLSYGFSGKINEWQIQGRRGNATASEKREPGYDIYNTERFRGEISPFNLEVGGGLGVIYNGFRFKAGYDFGLLNLYTGESRKGKLRRNQLAISIGYVF